MTGLGGTKLQSPENGFGYQSEHLVLMKMSHVMFENVTNAIVTSICNPNLNPTKLLNETFIFCSIYFLLLVYVHVF